MTEDTQLAAAFLTVIAFGFSIVNDLHEAMRPLTEENN